MNKEEDYINLNLGTKLELTWNDIDSYWSFPDEEESASFVHKGKEYLKITDSEIIHNNKSIPCEAGIPAKLKLFFSDMSKKIQIEGHKEGYKEGYERGQDGYGKKEYDW